MSNLEKILKHGFFYNCHDHKCHIVNRTNEYIVYKRYRNKSWLFGAESMESFEIHTEFPSLYTAERKKKK